MRDCGTCRDVKLLWHKMTVVERVFQRRLRDMMTVNEMQCGFLPGRGMDGGCVVHDKNVMEEL